MSESVGSVRVPLRKVHVLKDSVTKNSGRYSRGFSVTSSRSEPFYGSPDFQENLATTQSVGRDKGEVARLVHGALVRVEEGLTPGALSPGVLALLAEQDAQPGSAETFPSGSAVYEIVEIVRGEAGTALSGEDEVVLKPTNLTVESSDVTRTKRYGGLTPVWSGQTAPQVSLRAVQTPVEAQPVTPVFPPVAVSEPAGGFGAAKEASAEPASMAAPAALPEAALQSIPAERIPRNYAAIVAIIGPEKLEARDGNDVLVLDLESRDLPRGIAAKISELGLREVKVGGKYIAFSGATAQLIQLMSFLDAQRVKGKHSAQVQGFLVSELGTLKDKTSSPKVAPAAPARQSDGAFNIGTFCANRRCADDFRGMEPEHARRFRVVNGSGRADHMFIVLTELQMQSFSRTSLGVDRGSCRYTLNGVLLDLALSDPLKTCEILERELAPRVPNFKFFFLEEKSKGGYGGGYGGGSWDRYL